MAKLHPTKKGLMDHFDAWAIEFKNLKKKTSSIPMISQNDYIMSPKT